MTDAYKLTGKPWASRIVGHDVVQPDQLLANPMNARIHGKLQQDATAGNLDALGFVKSVVVNRQTGHVVDGHLRVTLALRNGSPVPVEYVDLTEAEEAQALATLDPLTELATYDAELLEALLAEVNTDDAALQEMLAQMAEDAGIGAKAKPVDAEPQIGRAEELAVKWGTSEGQIWQIGEHFVICGDCREPETWQRLLSAAGVDKVNGVFTSPPYAEQRKEQYGGVPTAEYVDWWEAVQANVRCNLAGDGSFFVNIKPHCEDGQRVLYVMDLVAAMVRRWGWRYIEELLWRNLSPAPGAWPERFKNGFEPVYQFAMGKTKFNPDNVSSMKDSAWQGDGGMNHTAYGKQAGRGTTHTGLVRPSNVIDSASSGGEALSQAAAFPVALPDFFIRAYSDPGDVWLDPFLGSGTVIVAAHQNKRRGLGSEKLPKYLGVILERLEKAVGVAPVLLEL